MIGIDFGASFLTVACISPQTGMPEAVRFMSGQGPSVKLPSVLAGTDKGFVIGYEAVKVMEHYASLPVNQRRQKMANVISEIRVLLTPGMKEHINGRNYTHAELLSIFFDLLLKAVKTACPQDDAIDDYVVLTHPVDIAHPKLEMMVEALHKQGVSRVKTLAEPFAAVKGYELTHTVNEGEGLLVFHFGAVGTEVCYMKKQEGKLHILAAPATNAHCGGNDLDYLLYEHLHNYLLKSQHQDISADGIDLCILQQCRKLKEMFGTCDDSVCETDIHHAGRFRLSREAFNALVYSKIDEAINVARIVANDVKGKKFNIDKILLVGGSSHLPLVKSHLSESFTETPIEMCCNEDTAAARGAIGQYAVGADGPFDPHLSMICRKCQSPFCFRYKDVIPGRGFVYHCLDCGWEGSGVKVVLF